MRNELKGNRIILVGGGSGGHLTPLVSVAEALKANDPSLIVCHIGQVGENLSEVTKHEAIDESYEISAGKFRRYHGESMIRKLFDIKTILLNVRDVARFIKGTFQSYFLLGRLKPTAIFLKGGFVSVPVGYAARARKIPYITHDSDAIPGLANRMTAAHAEFNATALPTELYPYDQEKSFQVGIPVQKEFQEVTPESNEAMRSELSIDRSAEVVLAVGGGLGAQKINNALIAASKSLLSNNPKLIILHLSGKSLYDETIKGYESELTSDELTRINVIDFSTTLYKLSTVADIVITRAGATNIAEFAIQAKACIVIPAPHLTGGQQLHNADVLEKAEAAIIVQENAIDQLESNIQMLLTSPDKRRSIADSLHDLAVLDAGNSIALMLLSIQLKSDETDV